MRDPAKQISMQLFSTLNFTGKCKSYHKSIVGFTKYIDWLELQVHATQKL